MTDAESEMPFSDHDLEAVVGDRRRNRHWAQQPRLTVVLYASAFVASEAIGALVGVESQAALDAVLILVAINHAIFGYRNRRTAGVVMTAVFASRLFDILLPATHISIPTRAALVALAMTLMSYLAVWVLSFDLAETRSVEGFPLKPALISRRFITASVFLAGTPIGLLAFHASHPSKLIVKPVHGSEPFAWLVVVGCLSMAALGEELLYRRLVAAMMQHTAMSQAPWVSATIWTASYLGHRNLAFSLVVFFTGALFAWSCERTGSIKGPVFSHTAINMLVFVVLPT